MHCKSRCRRFEKARDIDNEIAQQCHALNDTHDRHDKLKSDNEQLLENIAAQKIIAIEKETQCVQLTEKFANTDNLSHLDGDIFIFDKECSRLKDLIQQNSARSQERNRQAA